MDTPEQRITIPQWFELGIELVETWDPLIDRLVPAPPLMTEMSGSQLTLDEFDARELAEKVSHDAVLVARILAVANSARFGLATPMTSIQRAMVHLGFNMVRSIIVTYLLDSRFSQPQPVPRQLMEYVQRWTAGASVLAFRWGQAAQFRDPATAATLALLSRIGSLLLGLAQPGPDQRYHELASEPARLAYELAQWRVASPTLGGELARRWQVPMPIPRLIERIWEPVARVVSPDPLDPDPPVLTLVAACLTLVDAYLREAGITPSQVFDHEDNRYLKLNIHQHHLDQPLAGVWGSARVMRELATVTD